MQFLCSRTMRFPGNVPVKFLLQDTLHNLASSDWHHQPTPGQSSLIPCASLFYWVPLAVSLPRSLWRTIAFIQYMPLYEDHSPLWHQVLQGRHLIVVSSAYKLTVQSSTTSTTSPPPRHQLYRALTSILSRHTLGKGMQWTCCLQTVITSQLSYMLYMYVSCHHTATGYNYRGTPSVSIVQPGMYYQKFSANETFERIDIEAPFFFYFTALHIL